MNWTFLIPSYDEFYQLFIERKIYLLHHWQATLIVSISASLSALILTVMLSFILVRVPLLRRFLAPLIGASQSFPLQAVAPLFIVIFGAGFQAKLLIATLIAFFPMFASYSTSLEAVPARYIDYVRLCGASPWQIILSIRFRFSLPQLAASAKVGFTLATLGAVVAEFISPDKGMGYVLLVAQSNFDIPTIYACVLLLTIQGVIVYTIASFVEERLAKRRARND